MEYLIELHCHAAEVSGCSTLSGAQLADLYKSYDYHAIVIMDHYYKGFFDGLGDIPWNEKVDRFLLGYRNAKKRGDEIGLSVILGMELRFNNNSNDYLIFGLDESILYDHPELYNLGVREFSQFARDNGLLFIQAHPFREWMVVINHDYLDGIEIYNAHPWHNSRNYLAALAYDEQLKRHQSNPDNADRPFIATVGSDCHEPQHCGNAGIYTDRLPSNSAELVAILREQKYETYIKS